MLRGGTEDVTPLFATETALAAGRAAQAVLDAPRPDRVFLAGPENRLVVIAGQAILAGAQPAWNPVFLWGPSGLGKTHLAQGLVEAWQQTRPRRARAMYTTAADFTRQLSEAIEAQSLDDLRARCRALELLVIDEVVHLRGKVVAQWELRYTIDALIASGGRVVLTSTNRPQALSELLPALQSRLAGGLVVPLTAPSRATCQALLRHFAAAAQVEITNAAMELLLTNCPANPAALKGLLAQLQARARRNRTVIDHAVVAEFLRERRTDTAALLRQITTETCRYFALRVVDLRGQSRRRGIANARAVAMYLVRELTDCSLKQIGEYFGGRDHTTVLHSCLKTKAAVASDPETYRAVADISQHLQLPLPDQ